MPLFYLKISIYDQTNKFYDYLLKNQKLRKNKNFVNSLYFFYSIFYLIQHLFIPISLIVLIFFIYLFLFFIMTALLLP